MASASMMSDAIIGKTVDEAVALAEDFSSLVQGETVDEEPLGDAALLAGVQKFPARIKMCHACVESIRTCSRK